MRIDSNQVERELRSLLEGGMPIGDALRVLHHERGYGTMWIWPAVMKVQQITKQDAMRLVVHETAPWLGAD
jgi:hypothetical protein